MAFKTVKGCIRTHDDALITEVKATKDSDERRITGIANSPKIDRYGEIVEVAAYEDTIKIFKKNPIMLFMHNPYQPIGKFDEFYLEKDGLHVSGTLGKGFDPADRAWELITQGIMKAFSVGFKQIDGGLQKHGKGDDAKEIYHITKLELYEISVVSIPASREALFTFDDSGQLMDISFIPENLEGVKDEDLVTEVQKRGIEIPKISTDVPDELEVTMKELEQKLEAAETTVMDYDTLKTICEANKEKIESLEKTQSDLAEIFVAFLQREARKLTQKV